METQTCTKCGITYKLSLDNFGTSVYKGKTKWLRRCKGCLSEYKKQHYNLNKQDYLDRSKKQREDNHEEYLSYQRAYHYNNKEILAQKAKEYSKTDKGKAVTCRSNKNYRLKPQNKIKERAWKLTGNALKTGLLIRPNTCSKCNVTCKPEAHHTDYTKPLDITWLCKKCHENTHHLNEGNLSNE